MKIVLTSIYADFPAGLRSIAAFLEKHGHDVFLKHDPRPFSSLAQKIRKINPEITGLTCYTKNAAEVLKAARAIKENCPQTKIVLGNVHAAVFYDVILSRFSFIDYIIFGEGEVPMQELTEHLEGIRPVSQVHNLAYRNSRGSTVTTKQLTRLPDLDELPDIPQRKCSKTIFTLHYHRLSYAFKRRPDITKAVSFFSSRGCFYDCDYCAGRVISSCRWRGNSPEKVLANIKKLFEMLKVKHFSFQDPSFTLDRKRTEDICAKLEESGLNITWAFQTHPNHIDEALVIKARKAGCIAMTLGLDCFSERTMKIHRNTTVNYAKLSRVVKTCRKLKMVIKINMIAGWPDCGFRDLNEAVTRIRKLNPSHIAVHNLQLIPGSRMFDKAVSKKTVDKNYWLNPRNPPIYLGIYEHKKAGIREYCILRMQQTALTGAFLLYCGNLWGVLFLVSYNAGCWLDSIKIRITRCFKRKAPIAAEGTTN